MNKYLTALAIVAVLSSASIAEGVYYNYDALKVIDEDTKSNKKEIELLNQKLTKLRVDTSKTFKKLIDGVNIELKKLSNGMITNDTAIVKHIQDLLNEHIDFGTLAS